MNTTDSRDPPARADHSPGQLALGIAAVLLAAGLAYGAANIPSDAGYAGVGPDFLPWVVSAAMGLCGVLLIWEVRTGGFRKMEEPSGAARLRSMIPQMEAMGYKQQPQHLARGGVVRGPGTGTSDSIETEAEPGTFIMPADSTKAKATKAKS